MRSGTKGKHGLVHGWCMGWCMAWCMGGMQYYSCGGLDGDGEEVVGVVSCSIRICMPIHNCMKYVHSFKMHCL